MMDIYEGLDELGIAMKKLAMSEGHVPKLPPGGKKPGSVASAAENEKAKRKILEYVRGRKDLTARDIMNATKIRYGSFMAVMPRLVDRGLVHVRKAPANGGNRYSDIDLIKSIDK